jgi:hypothetical protein
VKTVCGCREKSVQTKEKYKLRFTTKAYKLSYNELKMNGKMREGKKTNPCWKSNFGHPVTKQSIVIAVHLYDKQVSASLIIINPLFLQYD